MEAQCAAMRIILFDGLPNTIYSRPLLSEGVSIIHENKSYFDDIFLNRGSDFVKSISMDSDFKKALKGEKSTLFTVEVNYIQLKKDVEKHGIKKQFGL